MSIDPIKLVNKILAPTNSPSTTSGSSTSTPAPTAATKTASARDYALSLDAFAGMGAAGSRTGQLATYNAKGLQSDFEAADKARKAEAASKPKFDPTESLLSDAKRPTGTPKASADVQAILSKTTVAKADAAMKSVDPKLAAILGVSRIIGTA